MKSSLHLLNCKFTDSAVNSSIFPSFDLQLPRTSSGTGPSAPGGSSSSPNLPFGSKAVQRGLPGYIPGVSGAPEPTYSRGRRETREGKKAGAQR